MRTTVSIDDHLLAQAKAFAAHGRRTLSEVIEDALRDTLRRSTQPGRLPTLPTFGEPGDRPLVDILDNDALAEALGDNEWPRRDVLIADVNVILGAFAAADPDHQRLRKWLELHLVAGEQFGVSEFVLSAVVRIATNHRVYPTPATPDAALTFCQGVRDAPTARIITGGSRRWSIFADLVRMSNARANVVPDAYLAALAIENGATFVTRDRSFARFPGLRVLDPLAG